jgi:hypothetical protein
MDIELSALSDRLGPEALGWLLATDRVTLDAWALGMPVPPSTEVGIRFLQQLLSEADSADKMTPLQAVATVLGRYDNDVGSTLAAHLRVISGGTLEVAESDDKVTNLLLALASELVGVHLLRPDEFMRAFIGGHGLAAGADHPLAQAANDLLVAELPFDDWIRDDHVVMRSSGTGAPMTTQFRATQILTDAAARWTFGPHWPQPAGFFAAIPEALQDLRQAIKNRPPDVPLLVGIAGLTLEEGVTVRLPWGELRNLREHERSRIRETEATTVLVSQMPFRMKLHRFEPPGDDLPDDFPNAYLTAQQLVHATTFALLLAGITPPARATVADFSVVIDPIQGIPQSAPGPTGLPSAFATIAAGQASDVARWGERFEIKHHKNIDVAFRRTVTATRRENMSDAFVDAIIGWDNLFGSRKGETVLRISASFAHLLGTTPQEKRAIAQQVKADYHLRSGLVHGSVVELPTRDATEARDRALDLLLRALRLIYTERDDLLAMDGGQRSGTLLLGAED